MSRCEHAETTTLHWLYGEGPEDHDVHVARCADCTEVAADHADVVAATATVWDALSDAGPRAPVIPMPRVAFALAAVAVAAAALLVVAPVDTPPIPQVPAADTDLVADAGALPLSPHDDLDLRLDAAQAELLDLTFDLETL